MKNILILSGVALIAYHFLQPNNTVIVPLVLPPAKPVPTNSSGYYSGTVTIAPVTSNNVNSGLTSIISN